MSGSSEDADARTVAAFVFGRITDRVATGKCLSQSVDARQQGSTKPVDRISWNEHRFMPYGASVDRDSVDFVEVIYC